MSQGRKLLITGTGRAGTTFIMRLFTLLGFDTGYKVDELDSHVSNKCKAGMEKRIGDFHQVDVVKSPWLYKEIPTIHELFDDLEVLVPIRDITKAAESRVRIGKGDGGLWYANSLDEQIAFYNEVLEVIERDCAELNIRPVYMEFEKFTTDVRYCYDTLNQLKIFQEVNYEDFVKAYRIAESIYK